MSVIRIASRYAKSLLDLAVEQNKLEKIKGDVDAFLAAVENRDFYLLIKSPIVNPTKKLAILKEIFGGKVDELTMTFFEVVLRKGRESNLPEIANEFISQYKVHNHISTVTLTTAEPLSEANLAAIREKLLGSSATESKVDIITKVDPDIIGGFLLEFDNQLYNASVAHKLDQMRKQFNGNQFVANV
ncbi:MAG: ATP synthase F1 subunit delta [Saprospiraceae bacterium]